MRAPTATIVPIREWWGTFPLGRGRGRRRAGLLTRARATPKRRRPDLLRRAVRLNERGAHSHVPNGGRERREPDRYRCGAVVGRLEESCEKNATVTKGDLYAELTDELPEDTVGPSALCEARRRVGWWARVGRCQPPKSLGSRGLVRPFSSGFVAHPSGHPLED